MSLQPMAGPAGSPVYTHATPTTKAREETIQAKKGIK